MSKLNGWAILTISGKGLDLDLVTAEVGRIPDRTVSVDRQGRTVWQLNSHPSGQAGLEEHISDLLEKLAPARRTIRKLSQQYNVRIACVMETGDVPYGAMLIPARFLLFAGYLGAEVELSFQASALEYGSA